MILQLLYIHFYKLLSYELSYQGSSESPDVMRGVGLTCLKHCENALKWESECGTLCTNFLRFLLCTYPFASNYTKQVSWLIWRNVHKWYSIPGSQGQGLIKML